MAPKLENMTEIELLLVSVLGGPEMEAKVDDELDRRALADPSDLRVMRVTSSILASPEMLVTYEKPGT